MATGDAVEYSGFPNKELREILKLPKTKPLVYYSDKHDASSKVEISSYWVERMFDEDEDNIWYGIVVVLPDGTEKRLHSAYFAMMQKKSFIQDIERSESEDGLRNWYDW